MDADTLRLILIVGGGLALAGLYLWERGRQQRREPRGRDRRDQGRPARPRSEPRLGPWDDGNGRDEEAGARREAAIHEPGPAWGPEPRPAPGAPGTEEAPPSTARVVEELTPPPPPQPVILQLHVAASGEPFDGAAIVRAAEGCGLEPGEMDIFHRYREGEPAGGTAFSMANMVKPGTFPFGAMASFQSPGLTLFAEARAGAEATALLEEMLAAGHCLASALEGELRDDTRAPLTAQGAARMRARLLGASGEPQPAVERV